jgi:endonuclease-8
LPEGDTIHMTAARLHRALAGQRLTATDFRVPRFATADLSGQRVLEVVARGKHLLLRTDAGVTLHSHLMMEGAWHLHRPGERWRGPAFQARVVLTTERCVAVGFRLGICELVPTDREQEVVGHLGPDVLGPDWSLERAAANLRAEPRRPIGVALLDQHSIAGPGNIWKSEICFLRGVSPWTPVGEVDDLEGMLDLLKRMMEVNRTIGQQVTTGDPRRGRKHWVAERAGEPCRRCGTPIRRGEQGPPGMERVTYWCPRCQRGPVPTGSTDRFGRGAGQPDRGTGARHGRAENREDAIRGPADRAIRSA